MSESTAEAEALVEKTKKALFHLGRFLTVVAREKVVYDAIQRFNALDAGATIHVDDMGKASIELKHEAEESPEAV